ncbi:serine protease nudel isoform X2 [Cardiocondyla obscurior]
MRSTDKLSKLRDEKSPTPQMVDIPIDPPCCVTGTRIRCTSIISDNCKYSEHGHSNFYTRHKYLLLTGAISILLIISFFFTINLIFSVISGYGKPSARVQPETRMERVIELGFPPGRRSLLKSWMEKVIDEDPSFNDRTELTSQITRAAEADEFPNAISDEGVSKRAKREVLRKRRDCDTKAKDCEILLKTVQDYIALFVNKLSLANGKELLPAEIIKCLECKDLLETADDENEVSDEMQPKDQYFPHEQNQSSDFSPVVIKLLDNEQAVSSPTRAEVNWTEAARIQPIEIDLVTNNPSQNVTNQSLKSDISETATVLIDHTNSNDGQWTRVNDTDVDNSDINNKRPGTSSALNYSQTTEVLQTDVSVTAKADQQKYPITEDEDITSTKFFTTESSGIRMQHGVITRAKQTAKTTITAGSTGTAETRTQATIDLTNQSAGNVMSVPAGYDVTGIDGGTMHPSTRPSSEGHPENRSATTVESKSMENDRNYEFTERPQTEDNTTPVTESTKFLKKLSPTTWAMTHPVCFFRSYPGPFPSIPASAFYEGPSTIQSHGFGFQNQLQNPSSPNYKPGLTMQFLSLNSDQTPTEQNTGPVPNVPITPLNQHLVETSQEQNVNMPYFCGYLTLATTRFPPVSDISQSDRSTNEAKELPRKPEKLSEKFNARYNPGLPTLSGCPINFHQCDNLECVPEMKWCDGRIDCTDVSDEISCSCRDRISQDRLCDGYFDCPRGEDELGCFDCPLSSFSCDDWYSRSSSNNCVPLSQRCDGKEQCPNGKDEHDCDILLEKHMDSNDIFMVGYTEGYLHKNVRGQWYPVCSKTLSWAIFACASEIGRPLTSLPEMEIVFENSFQNPYVIESNNGGIQTASCQGAAVFVKCPPLPCGTKTLPRQSSSLASNATKNNFLYRRHANEQSSPEFTRIYKETLGLLRQTVIEEGTQDQSDTIVGSQTRVVGGRASQPKAWPFLVAIYKDGHFHCGGVIINEIYILTAGHCMDRYTEHYFEIQAGILRRLSFSPMAQLRKPKYVLVHPGYAKREMQNDIAIIMLDRRLLFNRWVRQACLPSLATAGREWKEGPSPQSVCVATGWGAVKEDGPEPDHLREVEVPILPSCKYMADKNNATICAGYPEGGHDACQGDSGGPLMCRNPKLESQWYAAGLISHGDGCGRPNEPGVYMKLSYYLDWILESSETLQSQVMPLMGNKPLDLCPGFSCQSSLQKCLPREKRCDKIVNCLDAEDEIGCGFLKVKGRFKESNFNNVSAKQQSNKVLSESTKKKKASIEPTSFSTVSYFFQTETQTYSSENSDSLDAITPATTISHVKFTCKNLFQTISVSKKCNKRLDCEDGTDEENCTCKDYLLNFRPTTICDGHLDCDDQTDEKNCGICKDDEFHCNRSGNFCIPIEKKCDKIFNCPLREDEVDCLALTYGKYMNVDNENRPVLNREGLLSQNYNGTWHLACIQPDTLKNPTVMSMIGKNLCNYLGFAGLELLDRIVVNETVLETRFSRWSDNVTSYEPSPSHVEENERGESCTALQFRCRPVLSSSADSLLVVDPRTGEYTYLWPWLAAIFVDGRYHCTALLLESDWLLSTSSCTKAIRLSVNYTTALVGQSRSFLLVDGPHQQISVVDEIEDLKTTDVSLLHLKTAVNFTRYVQPLFFEKKIYPPTKDDLCVAIGTNKEHLTQSIFLKPVLQNCDNCHRCFVKTQSVKCLNNETSSNWNGLVFCRNEEGWYPAAVFYENDGLCSFRNVQNLTSIDYIYAYLTQALEKAPQRTPEATCDGVRCNIGQCVPWNQVCDGVADCRDGADEKDEMCLRVQQMKKENKISECAKSELRCINGECIPKSAFCDSKVDCSDGTDEPVICSCAEYLKLTKPERLCDGVRHCFDKTDESPEECQCTETSFKCNTESTNVTCVSQDFVCDGDNDCPNGEDEAECIKVRDLADKRPTASEVMQRTYGVWHTLCYSSEETSREEEAANVCRKSGYSNGIIDSKHQIFNQSVVPSLDDFYMVRLNMDTWITMREDKPLITLVKPEEACYRLFVKCS